MKPLQKAPGPVKLVLDKSIDFKDSDLIIILSRKKNRLILNEVELAKHLKSVFKYEVKLVRNEDHTFEEQIKLMRRARVVIAMHGSILIMGAYHAFFANRRFSHIDFL
jgi:capsular polysaccharide biosynthesis protein